MTSAVSYCAMIVRILKVVRAYIFLALNSRDIDITQYNFENGSGSVAEWLACWTQIAVATLSGNSLRQTVHTRRASVHQALVSVLLRAAGVIAGLAESNGSLPPGL